MIAALMAISTCTAGVCRRASGLRGVAGVVISLFNVLTERRVAVPAAGSARFPLLFAQRLPRATVTGVTAGRLSQGWPSASFAMRSQSTGKSIPAAAAPCGTRLVAVIPGNVFASRQ
jgi:hypothetical protein